jgi:hypothetical protein
MNQNDIKILSYLRNFSKNRASIIQSLDMPIATYKHRISCLKGFGFVTGSKSGDGNRMMMSITQSGIDALSGNVYIPKIEKPEHKSSPAKAQPMRINLFTLPVYQPNPCAYVRNNGHTHIQSMSTSA